MSYYQMQGLGQTEFGPEPGPSYRVCGTNVDIPGTPPPGSTVNSLTTNGVTLRCYNPPLDLSFLAGKLTTVAPPPVNLSFPAFGPTPTDRPTLRQTRRSATPMDLVPAPLVCPPGSHQEMDTVDVPGMGPQPLPVCVPDVDKPFPWLPVVGVAAALGIGAFLLLRAKSTES